MKIREYQASDSAGWEFNCPGCGDPHRLTTQGNGARWTFNANADSPTFTPSLITRYRCGDPEEPDRVCHLFIRDGKIEYLDDCTHGMAGQTVGMVELGGQQEAR